MSSPLPPPPPSPSKTLSRTNSVLSNSNSNSSSSNTKESDILLLQGQILETILTIKNDGAAPANEIFVKFSHPNIILSKISSQNHENHEKTHENGFELEPLYGRSGTVLKLLNKGNTPLLPGNELKYNLFLRLTETGKHRVSVIASCVCLKNDLESVGPQYPEAPTTPGYGGQGQGGPGSSSKHRTSIISFQVRIK